MNKWPHKCLDLKGVVIIKAVCERFFGKKRIICIISGLMAFIMVLLATGQLLTAGNRVEAASDANLQAMENKLDSIKKQKDEIAKKMAAAKADRAEAVQYKSYIDQQINIVNEEVATITDLIAELERKILENDGEIIRAQTERNKQIENFKQVMLLTYEGGNASYLEMILGAEDFYDFLTRVERVSALMDYCRTVMDEMKVLESKLEVAKAELEASKSSQLAYKNELGSKQVELEKLQYENENYLNDLKSDIDSYNSTYNSYAKAEAEIDAQIEKYLKDLQEKENSNYVGGEFIWPVPRNYRTITSPFGWRTIWGRKEFHLGIDIYAPKNIKIYASNGGKVITATYHKSYGNYVIIDHGGGKATLYAHANSLNVRVGDVVKQGDVIAYVGTTGSSTGYHLHFEVRLNGAKQDPLDYVKRP